MRLTLRGVKPPRHSGFRLLMAGQVASNTGDAFYAVALPWYVLAGHGGALLLGAVLAAYGIPRTVLVAVGGKASDRWRPWTVMMASDAVRALAVAGLAAAAYAGPPDPAVLIPIAVVIGAGEGLFLPGSFSIVPSLLPDADLQAGNALSASGTQIASLAGPALGGAVVALAGPAAAFTVDMVSFLVSAVSLAGIRATQRRPATAREDPALAPGQDRAGGSQPPAAGQVGIVPQPGEGAPAGARSLTLWELVRSQRVLTIIFAITLAGNLGSGGVSEVALPALAHGAFRTGATGYGGLLAAFAGGALAGALVAGRARVFSRPAVVASWAFLVDAACMALVPYLGSPLPAAAALAAVGAGNGFGNVLAVTALQRWAPPRLLGRVMGLILLASFGVFPVSVAVAGVTVHAFGPALFFPASAVLTAAAVLVGLGQRSWRDFGRAGADGPGPVTDAAAAPAPATPGAGEQGALPTAS